MQERKKEWGEELSKKGSQLKEQIRESESASMKVSESNGERERRRNNCIYLT